MRPSFTRMIMARISLKLLIMIVGTFPLMLTVYNWGRCDINNKDNNFFRDGKSVIDRNDFDTAIRIQREAQSLKQTYEMDVQSIPYKEIECVINGDYSVKGRKEDKEIYMPFSFIQRYFEVYGSLETNNDGYERFAFHHSYSDMQWKPQHYSPDGVFMMFDSYVVEHRDRVKCISAIEGVPVSTQWTPSGHYYPIQIAQFGLSHYSKYLMEPKSKVMTLQDGEGNDLSEWILPDRMSEIRTKTDTDNYDNNVIEFNTQEAIKNPGITLSVDEAKLVTLSLDVKFINNGSLTVLLRTGDGNLFRIHYILSDKLMSLEGRDLYYGLGVNKKGKWIHLTRKIMVDFQKGLALKLSKEKRLKFKNSARIAAVCFRGHGVFDNVSLSYAAHLDHFFDAANYLVRKQDHNGGWPIMVTRKLIPKVLELSPGWYSSMGQGQAISLLVRAYLRTKDKKYLNSASKALKLFKKDSAQGGVLTKFAGTYDWYEEYPTTPSSYVLNGFIYSLMGLYDLKETASGETSYLAEKLYNAGMDTLRHMLLMFDSGTGTFYDLKHLTLGIAPNRARWDYHLVHINQLQILSLIDKDPLFPNTAKRWTEYMKGKRSPHN